MERTETGYEITPECKETRFTVTKPAEKGKTQKGKYYYIFRFKAVINGEPKAHSEVRMTWMAGDLLGALRCKEEKPGSGTYLWEKDEIVGRAVIADIVHGPDFKNPDKPVATMTNIRPADDDEAELPVGSSLAGGDDIPF